MNQILGMMTKQVIELDIKKYKIHRYKKSVYFMFGLIIFRKVKIARNLDNISKY
jgi:hypothetical protein